MIYGGDNVINLAHYVPTDSGIKTILAAIKVKNINIYRDYELLPITEYIERNIVRKVRREQMRVATTMEIMAAIEYIRENKLA